MSLKAGGVALNLTVASHVSLANLLCCQLTFTQQYFLQLAVNSRRGGNSAYFSDSGFITLLDYRCS